MLLLSWILLRCFRTPLGVLLVMKTHEDEQYVVIKAYKFTVVEIWRDFNVLSYIACLHYPYIRVYRHYDSSTLIGMFSSIFMSAQWQLCQSFHSKLGACASAECTTCTMSQAAGDYPNRGNANILCLHFHNLSVVFFTLSLLFCSFSKMSLLLLGQQLPSSTCAVRMSYCVCAWACSQSLLTWLNHHWDAMNWVQFEVEFFYTYFLSCL